MDSMIFERKKRIEYFVNLYCAYHSFDDEIKETLINLIFMMMNVYGYDTKIALQPDINIFTGWPINPLFAGRDYYIEDIILNKLFFNIQDIKLVESEEQIPDEKVDYDCKTRTVYIDKSPFLDLKRKYIVNGNVFASDKEMTKRESDIKRQIYFAPILGALQTNFDDKPLNENSNVNKQYLNFLSLLERYSFQAGHVKYYRDFVFKRPETYFGTNDDYEHSINYITFSSNYPDLLREGEINFILDPQLQTHHNLNDYVAIGVYNQFEFIPHSSNYGVMLMAALGPTRVFKRLYCDDNHPTNDFSHFVFKRDFNKSFESLISRIEFVLSKTDIYQSNNGDNIKKLIEIELELMSSFVGIYEIRLSYDGEYQDKRSEKVRDRIALETTLMHNFHLQNRLGIKAHIIDFSIFKTIQQNLTRIDAIKERYKVRTF